MMYTVQPGDQLPDIARKFMTTTEHLAGINGISEPYKIHAGQQLRIGSVSGCYLVAAGDSLSRIAEQCGTTWEALAALNKIPNPDYIEAGQVLRLQ